MSDTVLTAPVAPGADPVPPATEASRPSTALAVVSPRAGKALIVRLSAIGDVVHTLPVLAALHRHGWQVGWVVESPASALLDRHPQVTRPAPIPAARKFSLRAARSAAASLAQEHYDVALDLQGLWKSALWARLSRASRVLGYDSAWRREPLSRLLVRERVALPPEARHVIDKNLALLRPLGIDAVGLREFPLPSSALEAERVDLALGSEGFSEFVLLNPGGGWASKLWPAERYGELARGLRERRLRALVAWGPGEEALADRVVAASDGAARRSFPTTLLEYVELARRAKLVVAADTGPLHLACAVRTPVVGLFGPTDPGRNGPFSEADRVVRRTPLCSPCHRRRCSDHEGVMREISVAEVLRAIDQRLLQGREGRSNVAV